MTTSAWTDDAAASPTTQTGLLSYVSGAAGRLILISFLSLYLELTFIRWAPMQVRLLAYFSNYVLIAALLGLGLGMMLADKRSSADRLLSGGAHRHGRRCPRSRAQ